MAQAKGTNHFLTLDLLRGVAALMVMLLHFFLFDGEPWFGSANLAVDFFFMLSGFVIAYAYEDKLRATMTPRRFLTARFVRLYPIIFLAVVIEATRHVLAALVMHGEPLRPAYYVAVAANLFMIPLPVDIGLNPDLFPLDPALWSLFFEAVANILYAYLFVRMSNGLLFLIVVGSALLMLGIQADGLTYHAIGGGEKVYDAYVGVPRVLFSFCLGVLLFRWREENRLPTYAVGPLALSLALLIIFFPHDVFWGSLGELDIIGLVFPVIIILGANYQPKGAAAKVSTALGELSYPLYALHMPLVAVLLRLLTALHVTPDPPRHQGEVFVLCAGVLACIGASMALIFFDRPARAWLSKRLLAPTRTTPPAPPAPVEA